jgi:hypothetical protein
MSVVYCGFKNINLIRRPFKKMAVNSGTMANMRIEKLGNFNLIPLDNDSYYNTENQIFPMGTDTGQIYLISDPNVGVLIPHIKKESKYVLSYKNIDLDGLYNKSEFNTFISNYRDSLENSGNLSDTLSYSVYGFIFIQPIFLNSSGTWYVYTPMYKINDDDVKFEKRDFDISSMFNVNSSLEINDVVISNQDVDDMNFSQFAIGKNGLSMRNGMSYTISETGDVNFNVGNIKSDSTPFMKIKMKLGDTFEVVEKKLESESYRKGDVISGTSITSLLNSIFQDMSEKIDELSNDIHICSTYGSTQNKSVVLKNGMTGIPDTGIIVRLMYKSTVSSPTFSFNTGNTGTEQRQIKYNDKCGSDLTLIPAGYYRVKSIGNKTDGFYWQFTRESNGLFDKMNIFFNKTSNFDILIVKK